MLLGIQIAMVSDRSFDQSVRLFADLQEEHALNACEMHLEASLYRSACWPWDENAAATILEKIRPDVQRLGVHLPFMDLNPISGNPRAQEMSRNLLEEALVFASGVSADYVVFHARGQRYPVIQGAEEETDLWTPAVQALAEQAERRGIRFCLENADNLHDLSQIRRILGDVPLASLCLDIGHLYERQYPSGWTSKLLLLMNDRFSPRPFAMLSGLPASAGGGLAEILRDLAPQVACVHIHNHDGRTAHMPLGRGRVDLSAIRDFKGLFSDVPLILESDYRNCNPSTVHDDLCYLRSILA